MEQLESGSRWAALTVWAVVNAVNLLQAAGFLSRLPTRQHGDQSPPRLCDDRARPPGSAGPRRFLRAGAGWLQWVGPAVYLAFIALMVVVDYAWPVEFRSPKRPGILVPYLVLFFGAILLMGLPMFRLDRRLWLVTVATTVLLLASMGIAMRKGVA